MSGDLDNPGVRIPPPLIFLATFLAGLPLRRWFPAALVSRPIALLLGVAAIAIVGWGLVVMQRVRTGIMPHHSASTLVTWGPFRYSRNPLYIAMLLGFLSAALWIGSTPSLVLLPLALVLLYLHVIRREEAYLTRRFGEEYRAYCAQVSRWIGRKSSD